MKITVVGGAGAMGAVWASRLSAAGHQVAILDVAKDALAVIARDGLTVEQKDGSPRTFQIVATDQARDIGVSDAVIFFTKAHHTEAAADLARPLVGPETTVVSLQNGWGNSDRLATIFAPRQIAMGVTYHSAKVLAPGRIAHTADAGPTYVGPYQDGAPIDRAQAIGDAMTGAGIKTTVTPDIKTEVWKKLVLNCATLPISGLTRLTTGGMGQHSGVLAVSDQLAREASAVARGLGMAVEDDERIAAVHAILAVGGAGKASMLQDVEARRKTEIEVVNGAVVREGDRLGIPVPLNRAMVALIGGLEQSWRE
jgi:2-dehydropantoate 2-reductase